MRRAGAAKFEKGIFFRPKTGVRFALMALREIANYG
jgi:hypothetical protein